jgi:ABC-2 type transport system ATP-binding protein
MVSSLSVRDLTYMYGQRVALDRVTFFVPHGRTIGLLGPNGAGKTTTIHCIAGLKSNWQGSLELAGEPFLPGENTVARREPIRKGV